MCNIIRRRSSSGAEDDRVDMGNKLDARIGVILRDRSSDWEISHRADERFPMASTFKTLLCGAILGRVDAGQENLTELVSYSKKDLVPGRP